MFALGGVLYLLNDGHDRPEGAAERWLEAVGDTTRKGVERDATERAEKVGALSNADGLISGDTNGKSAFADIEVGKAGPPNGERMRFRVHARRGDDTEEIDGVITMTKADADRWHVANVVLASGHKEALDGLPALPSEGGPPPSSAPWSLWIGALVGSLVIGVVTSALVRAAGRSTAAAAAA
jgi:hypothetical protein